MNLLLRNRVRHGMTAKNVKKKITVSSGNVFTDLGFDDAEAQVLALRADLMATLEKRIKAKK